MDQNNKTRRGASRRARRTAITPVPQRARHHPPTHAPQVSVETLTRLPTTPPRYAKPQHPTWNDAVLRYLDERSDRASIETTKVHLRWLDQYLNGVELVRIDRQCVDALTQLKRCEVIMVRTSDGPEPTGETIAPATVNRVLGVLSAVLRAAVDWEWIDRAPKITKLRTPTKRIRWLTPEEAKRLIAALPPHLAAMAKFSLETGLRRANVTGLEWTQVDLKRCMAWIHADQAKARRPIAVPLSDAAICVLEDQRQAFRHPEYQARVFVYRGWPIHQTTTEAWRKGLQKAGIADFRWHDLRHTWASWHVQRGTPLQVLKELGGWETTEMVQRYAHLAADHLKQWVRSF